MLHPSPVPTCRDPDPDDIKPEHTSDSEEPPGAAVDLDTLERQRKEAEAQELAHYLDTGLNDHPLFWSKSVDRRSEKSADRSRHRPTSPLPTPMPVTPLAMGIGVGVGMGVGVMGPEEERPRLEKHRDSLFSHNVNDLGTMGLRNV